jgi:Tol biopolymer transport system component
VCVALPPVDAPPGDTVPPPDSGERAFGTPQRLPFSRASDDDPTLTADLLELYFNRDGDIFVVQRASVDDAWSTPAVVPELSSVMNETTPEISGNGREFFFTSDRGGALDIWTSTRASRAEPWSTPVLVPELSSSVDDAAGGIGADGLEITVASMRVGDQYDLYRSTRANRTAPWSMPVAIAAVNAPFQDESPLLADPLTLYFDADRDGDDAYEIYRARRSSPTAPFGAPEPVAELNTAMRDHDPWVSPDGRYIVFMSDRLGEQHLFEASR